MYYKIALWANEIDLIELIKQRLSQVSLPVIVLFETLVIQDNICGIQNPVCLVTNNVS